MTILEDPNNRGSEMKANSMEGNSSQEDQNQRRAVVAGFHDDTTEQEGSSRHTVERNHNNDMNVNGSNSDHVSNRADHTCILAI